MIKNFSLGLNEFKSQSLYNRKNNKIILIVTDLSKYQSEMLILKCEYN